MSAVLDFNRANLSERPLNTVINQLIEQNPGAIVEIRWTAIEIRQTYPGVPQLSTGTDYVLYLWTSPSSAQTR